VDIWMVTHLIFNEHLNRCMEKAWAAEERLQSLTRYMG
jgi:hypothetical protein